MILVKIFTKAFFNPDLQKVAELKQLLDGDVTSYSTPYFPNHVPEGVAYLGAAKEVILQGLQHLPNNDLFLMGDKEWLYWNNTDHYFLVTMEQGEYGLLETVGFKPNAFSHFKTLEGNPVAGYSLLEKPDWESPSYKGARKASLVKKGYSQDAAYAGANLGPQQYRLLMDHPTDVQSLLKSRQSMMADWRRQRLVNSLAARGMPLAALSALSKRGIPGLSGLSL